MEREQIIKALECCTEQEYCVTCPYAIECVGMESLILDALSLIKELTEDVERVTKQCGKIIVECDERDAERLKQVAELTVENERLHASCTEFERKCASLNDENERLRAEVSVKKKLLDKCVDLEDKVKADTVRKMQERLKETLKKNYPQRCGECFMERVDQIAKEMLEGEKGETTNEN